MNISTNRTMSVICWPFIKICQWMGRHTPATLMRIRYLVRFRRLPNLKNPKDLNEKILWLKLYSDTSIWTLLADKYEVRKYIKSLGLEEYLVKLYGHWYNVDDINFNSLPEDVIFKANNGDGKGTNLIVRNVHSSNLEHLKKIFKGWLNDKHVGDLGAEPQYRGMRPCIIAEEVLPIRSGETSLIDYKIWCINGNPLYIRAYSNRNKDGGGAQVMTYDTSWKACPQYNNETDNYKKASLLPKPKNLNRMLEIAAMLSRDFPILRVDLYNIDGKIYFGELTFTSNGGMMNSVTKEFLQDLGEMADISSIKRVR